MKYSGYDVICESIRASDGIAQSLKIKISALKQRLPSLKNNRMKDKIRRQIGNLTLRLQKVNSKVVRRNTLGR